MAFEGLSSKLNSVFSKLRKKGKLNEQDIKLAMREVRMALLEADVNFKVAKDFTDSVSERALGAEVMKSLTPAQQVIKIVNDELTATMGGDGETLKISGTRRNVIMMCGLQGAGKTTHCAKLAKKLKRQGHRPLLVACDIYRPAAIDQLKIVGAAADVPVFEMGQVDPVKIAKKALEHAKEHGNNVVILDTAGRLHIDDQLMEELKQIKTKAEVTETLLVVDSMTGQDAVNVAQSFDDQIGIDGVVLTKLDGDTRGGAALSVRAVTGKPIKLVGVGEKLDELEDFHPSRMASRILGMGDVLSFVERASQEYDQQKAAETAKKLQDATFDMDDLLEQIKQLKKMGGMTKIAAMLPNNLRGQIPDTSDDAFKTTEAIIHSMTLKERHKPSIIDPKRKRRIAAGSGTRVEDVNRLLKQFEQMSKLMKQYGKQKPGKMRGMPGMPPGFNF